MYSSQEIKDILYKVSQQKDDVKFEKFEKLGIHSAVNLTNENSKSNYTCEFCKKNLLSSHLLDLHVSEHHDTFFELQKAKKPSCFLEACTILSNNSDERKNHCIIDHKFPHDFPYFDNSSHVKKSEDENKKKTSPVSKNFHFGHRTQKTFKSTGQTKIDLKDLMDVLPDA